MRDWNFREETYGDKENRRRAQMRRAEKAEAAYSRLEEGQNVKTPDGWVGFISEKDPDGMRVYVETWDTAGTYFAHVVEPTDDGSSGVSL